MKITFLKLATYVILLISLVRPSFAQEEAQPVFTQNIRVVPQTISSCGFVRLDVAVQYLGTTPRKAWLPVRPTGEVIIEVSRLNALALTQQKSISVSAYYLYTDAHVDDVPPYDFVIPPRASATFAIEAVYDYHNQQFLFEEAGQYRIVVKSSVPTTETDGVTRYVVLTSEKTLTVTAYEGKDKELWERVISNVSWRGNPTPENLRDLKRLIEQFPQSPYRPYALAILGDVFSRHMQEQKEPPLQRMVYLQEILKQYPEFAWKDRVAAKLYPLLMNEGEVEQAQEVAAILFNDPWAPFSLKYQIRQFQPSVIYPKDKRLDQKITYYYPTQTPYEEVLKDLSKQSGVSLNLHPELKKRSRASRQTTEPLREAMRSLSSYKAMWIRDGEGYRLIPKAISDE